jgi:chemotaxis response regulator CheB
MTQAFRIIVIGGSGPGSLEALSQLLSNLPSPVLPLVLVALSHQTITSAAVRSSLASRTRLLIKLARDGERAERV